LQIELDQGSKNLVKSSRVRPL